MNKRILFSGFSGSGKTTLAEALSGRLDIPFVSGSIYDLIPDIDKNQEALNKKSPVEIYQRNLKILALRRQQYRGIQGSFISDRSIFDTMGYTIHNGHEHLDACDLDSYVESVNNVLAVLPEEQRITHIIYIPFGLEHFFEWELEDNGKRINSPYYQASISQSMSFAYKLQGVQFDWYQRHFCKNPIGKIQVHPPTSDIGETETWYTIKLLILRELDFNKRMNIIKKFVK